MSESSSSRRFTGDGEEGEASAGQVARVRARSELGLTPLLDPAQRHGAVRAALEGGKERETLEGVVQYKSEREREIREVCDVHYQEFVRSVDELTVGNPRLGTATGRAARPASDRASTSSLEISPRSTQRTSSPASHRPK